VDRFQANKTFLWKSKFNPLEYCTNSTGFLLYNATYFWSSEGKDKWNDSICGREKISLGVLFIHLFMPAPSGLATGRQMLVRVISGHMEGHFSWK
jgi:hypothetical protein